MKDVAKRTIILGIIFILMAMSIIPIQASENKKDAIPLKTQVNGENILAYINVGWDTFFTDRDPFDQPPRVNITQSATRDFYFPEINGTIQMNFTVVCKQRYENPPILLRFTRFDLSVYCNNTYRFQYVSSFQRCKAVVWQYNNIAVGPNDVKNPLYTNGSNWTVNAKVGALGVPFGIIYYILGYTSRFLEPITVHPIPTPP